ncbi:unnamed protein product [Didymodactylos carnosus]|uniref:Uncharacterized protein n=2 Tax=Didymodactylos carnosus TaxID=1234261 RepID=A0A816CDU5_9BILA|nr:unnamed protein product [Didymodactylos carnosus]CAF4515296.1 unnamed protein product [Didymodactylos carnosus]
MRYCVTCKETVKRHPSLLESRKNRLDISLMSHSHKTAGVYYSPTKLRDKPFSATIVNKTSQPVTAIVLYTCDKNYASCQDQTLRSIINANGGELRANEVSCEHQGVGVYKEIKQIEIEKQDSAKMVLSAPFEGGSTNLVFEVSDNEISAIRNKQ